MKKVLVPVGRNGLDNVTLGFAKDFAVNLGAKLEVVTVLFYSEQLTPSHLFRHVSVEEHHFEAVCEEILAHAVKQLADAGVSNVTTATLKGDPASEIIDYADKEKCDLILIHTHGLGLVKRFAVGSVTNTLVHHANVPVLVVK